jgi:hypothetical protein
MKTWGIVATILLIASLFLNAWERDSKYQLPFETMYELTSNTNILVDSILGYRMQHFQSVQEHDGLGNEKAITTATHNLTISINGQGIINPSEGTHEYPGGTQVTINVSAISGWEFAERICSSGAYGCG